MRKRKQKRDEVRRKMQRRKTTGRFPEFASSVAGPAAERQGGRGCRRRKRQARSRRWPQRQWTWPPRRSQRRKERACSRRSRRQAHAPKAAARPPPALPHTERTTDRRQARACVQTSGSATPHFARRRRRAQRGAAHRSNQVAVRPAKAMTPMTKRRARRSSPARAVTA